MDSIGMTASDYVMILIYFALLITTGIFSSLKNRGTVSGYFLAGRSANWVVIGSSLFASNIGSGHFVGLAGTAAKTGITISAFEMQAVFELAMLGWLFLPVYRATGVYTMPQYMFIRFGGTRIRVYLAITSLILYIFTKISADLHSGSLLMQYTVEGEAYHYVFIISVVTVSAVITISGGLTAIMWTNTIQTVIMIVGGTVLMVLAFIEVGGYEEMKRKFPLALADTVILNSANTSYPFRECGRIKHGWFNMMLPASDPDLPWSGLVFGLGILGIWYWCTDQVIVQKLLAAKNMSHGRMGCVMVSLLKFTPMWLIVFPGMISRILYPNEVGCNEPDRCKAVCGLEDSCSDIAYPLLIVRLMPAGVRGLSMAVMMSALVSSIMSVFNSTSTVFTIDVWNHCRKQATDVELMIVGRIVVVVLVVISVVWFPVVYNSADVYTYIQKMTSCFGVPISAAFVVAIFWNRCTESGVFWGLMFGTFVGMVRVVWDGNFINKESCGITVETRASDVVVTKVNFLHFAAINFVLTIIMMVALSLIGVAPQPEDYVGKTFCTRSKAMARSDRGTTAVPVDPSHINLILGDKSYEEQPRYTKACLWLCGVELMLHTEREADQEDHDQQISSHPHLGHSLYEDPRMAAIMHVNMAMVLAYVTIYWAFYSVTPHNQHDM